MKLEDRRGKPEVEEDAGGEIKLRWQPAFLAVAGGRGLLSRIMVVELVWNVRNLFYIHPSESTHKMLSEVVLEGGVKLSHLEKRGAARFKELVVQLGVIDEYKVPGCGEMLKMSNGLRKIKSEGNQESGKEEAGKKVKERKKKKEES
ncbi:hypothetical protein M9H77_04466 [Catharanthus roseus]|uniref:Uncharacterized protein n=1 Tax=Catharanthus roseus TaxID=4058 RepID=A0ACC0CEK8_CATRO|nr:hypothetical protein M9H77_04466 [Catharanthus roseus]